VAHIDPPRIRPHLLPPAPAISPAIRAQIQDDHDRFARVGLPADLNRYLLETYRLDMVASYAGIPLRNPWGKASGQLSLNRAQVEEAAAAGLGLVVLKTVIAQDRQGCQTMSAWAVKETQMVCEPITSPTTGARGWTITWRGRGWWQSFDDYLTLVRESVAVGIAQNMLVVPSVKYHLPSPGETEWRSDEYVETTRALLKAFEAAGGALPMPIEKDFSPTLAGSDRASRRAVVLEWLQRAAGMIRSAVPAASSPLKVGLKLFNSVDTDEFQLAMLAEVHRLPEAARPDFLIYANRLFDPERTFEGTKGVAHGGPDLSDRNLRLLGALRTAQADGQIDARPLEISGTGDIHSGKIAVEYTLRGCTSFQIHTLFQLPASEYAMRSGTKLERALHRLYFDPSDGFIIWARHAANFLGTVGDDGVVRFLDLAGRGARSPISRRDLDPDLR
jgi:dihydroorotate dehydrogenase